MIRFNILGIPVQVDPWFWITLAFIGGALGATTSYKMLLVLVFVFAGFLSVLVHELGHALMVRKYGLPTSITLQAFGGYASFPANSLDRKQSFIVTAMGPAVQLLLGVGLYFVMQSVAIPEGSLFEPFINYLIVVSVVWSLLNCLPIFPLDGGQMLSAVLGPRRESTVYFIGVITSIVVGLIAVFMLRAPLLGIFCIFFAWSNWQQMQNAS